jgi:hypothetical protein
LLTETVGWQDYLDNTYTLTNPCAWPIIRLDAANLPQLE